MNKYQTEERMRKFQTEALYRLANLDSSWLSNSDRKKLGSELKGLLRNFQPEIILEWCTPHSIVSGKREVQCGDSYDDPGLTYMREYIEAQYGYTSIGVRSIREGIEQRREILGRYFQEAKTNPTMRKIAIQYKDQIKRFLKKHPRK